MKLKFRIKDFDLKLSWNQATSPDSGELDLFYFTDLFCFIFIMQGPFIPFAVSAAAGRQLAVILTYELTSNYHEKRTLNLLALHNVLFFVLRLLFYAGLVEER